MRNDTFELDTKVYLPRMRRFRRKLDPDAPRWMQIKTAISAGTALDWDAITSRFRLGSLLCPEKMRPASRNDHRNLKGLYAFFQNAYILRDATSVALHARVDKKQRITTGHSIIVSSTPQSISSHSQGLQKLESHIEHPLQHPTPRPFAIGYTELQGDGEDRYPAYVWLVHDMAFNGALPKRRNPRPDHDSFIGMKDLSRLHRGQVRCNRESAQLNGAFDRALVEMLATNRECVIHPTTAVRRLTQDEIRSIPTEPFRRRTEKLRNRLIALGLLAAGAPVAYRAATELVDLAMRSEWVQENWDEIRDWVQTIKQIAEANF